MAQVVEHLLNKHRSLSSNSSTAKKKKKKKLLGRPRPRGSRFKANPGK
jgi:hypothetical protein